MVVKKNNILIRCTSLVLISLICRFVRDKIYTTLRCFLLFLYVALLKLWIDIIFNYIYILVP
jgi:hypothetical protein